MKADCRGGGNVGAVVEFEETTKDGGGPGKKKNKITCLFRAKKYSEDDIISRIFFLVSRKKYN